MFGPKTVLTEKKNSRNKPKTEIKQQNKRKSNSKYAEQI